MCLIYVGPSAKVKHTLLNTPRLLESIHKSNPDGFGIMWPNRNGLKIVKRVPKSIDDIRRVLESLPDDDRNVVGHHRMTTHGKTDLDNCHPYVVVPGRVAMVHNGILHTGNDRDPTRSDTYHFIQEFLVGPVTEHPEIVHNEGFVKLVAEFIDNNRFVFMDADGRMTIVNREQGLEHDGLWFANTYAWDPALLIPGYRRYGNYGNYGAFSRDSWGDDDDLSDYFDKRYGAGKHGRYRGALALPASTDDARVPTHAWTDEHGDEFVQAVVYMEVDTVARHLGEWPYSSLTRLFKEYAPNVGRYRDQAPDGTKDLIDAVARGETYKIAYETRNRGSIVAETLCYYIDWEPRDSRGGLTAGAQAANADVLDDAQDDVDDVQVCYYQQHRIELAFDDQGWGYTVEDPAGDIVAADIGYRTEESARRSAFREVDQIHMAY